MSDRESSSEKKQKKKVSKKIKVPEPVPKRMKVKAGAKRDRKSTDHFNYGELSPKKSVPLVLHKKGKGKKLGDISYIDGQITKRPKKDDAMRSFHSLVLGRVNKDTPIKENLRQFSGLYYTDKEIDRPKYEAKLAKWTVAKIKDVLMFVGQETKGHRDEVVDRLMEFIEKPPSKVVVEHHYSPIKKRKAPEKDEKVAKRKKMKKRDPDAPKRPMSGYIFYCNAKRDEVVKEFPGKPVTHIAKELAKMWKKATPEDMKKFQKKAKKDKERYEKERDVYLAKKKAEAEEEDSSSSSSDSDSSSSSSDSE